MRKDGQARLRETDTGAAINGKRAELPGETRVPGHEDYMALLAAAHG